MFMMMMMMMMTMVVTMMIMVMMVMVTIMMAIVMVMVTMRIEKARKCAHAASGGFRKNCRPARAGGRKYKKTAVVSTYQSPKWLTMIF